MSKARRHFFTVSDLAGHASLGPAPTGGVGPFLGQVEPPVQGHRGGVGGRVQAHPGLAQGLFAQGAAPLVGRAHRCGPRFGKGGVVDHPRIGLDRLADLGRYTAPDGGMAPGEEATNCCRACMFPSGRRWAMGWMDLRSPSSISPRR